MSAITSALLYIDGFTAGGWMEPAYVAGVTFVTMFVLTFVPIAWLWGRHAALAALAED